MDGEALDQAMRQGGAVDRRLLANRMYEGVSLNLPGWLTKLTWVKFAKVFKEEAHGELRGWNCRVRPSPLDAPWQLERKGGAPITYGHYTVRPVGDYVLPRPYGAGGLLLDYGAGGNARLDPTGRVRDPLVALDESSELLLGWSYVDAGPLRLSTPSFFVLRRGAELDHDATPARQP